MTSRHQLAPDSKCAVCNDVASGFHYGVDSCEGCKGFFRRCITQGINFRCSNEEKCQITPFTRNSCQYCRLKKSFQVGMSREASRLGRRPKKVMKSSGISSRDLHPQLSKHMDTKCVSNNTVPAAQNWDYPELANAALSDVFGCPPEMMKKLMGGGGGGIPGGGGMPPFGFPGMAPSFNGTAHPGHQMGGDSNAPPMDLSNPTKSPNTSPQLGSEQVTHTDLNKWREKQFEVMSKYMHNKDSPPGSELSMSEGDMMVGRSDEVLSKGSSPSSSDSQTSPLSLASGMSSSEVSHCDITAVSPVQQRRLDMLVSYATQETKEDMFSLMAEVHQGIVDCHMEHCYHLRPRINAVSAELDAREQAGEDIRPPAGFWAHWMSELLPAIERVVRFLKDTPGFRELPINDQIILIKKGAYDIVLSQMMPMIDPYKFTILDPQLRYRNRRDDFEGMPQPIRMLFEDYFGLSKEFKLSGITDDETALINAILGVNSTIEGFENPKAVKKLECLFVQTLLHHVSKTLPDQPNRFESLLRLIPIVDNASQAHSNSIHCIKTKVPVAENPFPPLHHEIFG